jgi:hypothetical protein
MSLSSFHENTLTLPLQEMSTEPDDELFLHKTVMHIDQPVIRQHNTVGVTRQLKCDGTR